MLLVGVSRQALLVPEVQVAVRTRDPIPLQNLVVVFQAVLVHVQHVLVGAGTVVASEPTWKKKKDSNWWPIRIALSFRLRLDAGCCETSVGVPFRSVFETKRYSK